MQVDLHARWVYPVVTSILHRVFPVRIRNGVQSLHSDAARGPPAAQMISIQRYGGSAWRRISTVVGNPTIHSSTSQLQQQKDLQRLSIGTIGGVLLGKVWRNVQTCVIREPGGGISSGIFRRTEPEVLGDSQILNAASRSPIPGLVYAPSDRHVGGCVASVK